jgi:hypothetical protein
MAREFVLKDNLLPVEYKLLKIANQAYAIGDAVMWNHVGSATVDVIPATSSTITSNIAGVAMSAQLSTDTTLLVALVRDDQRWGADTTNTANAAHNGQRMVIGASAGLINNTGTDSTAGIFQQTGVLALEGTTRIVGRFLPGFSAA